MPADESPREHIETHPEESTPLQAGASDDISPSRRSQPGNASGNASEFDVSQAITAVLSSLTEAQQDASESFSRLCDVVRILRSPEGCPWDREQSLATLRDALIEEAYECVDAITEGDADNIREELGDVFLLATMMSHMQEQAGAFTVADVLNEISEKLVRRHPHVFGESSVTTTVEVLEQWNAIKQGEKPALAPKSSVLTGIPASLPPLRTAVEFQKKAAKLGFDWPERLQIFDKLHEEVSELVDAIHGVSAKNRQTRAAVNTVGDAQYVTRLNARMVRPDTPPAAPVAPPTPDGPSSRIEEEIGDILFTVVNIARSLEIEPDIALQRTNAKFKKRFAYVERRMSELGEPMEASNLAIMDRLWEESKIGFES